MSIICQLMMHRHSTINSEDVIISGYSKAKHAVLGHFCRSIQCHIPQVPVNVIRP